MNERTSKRVAKIAGKVLSAKSVSEVVLYDKNGEEVGKLSRADLRALAASALTQAADVTE